MKDHAYYSRRNARDPGAARLGLAQLKELVLAAYEDFDERGYFAEAFGSPCEDGPVAGSLGYDVGRFLFRKTRKKDLWPLRERIGAYTEDDLFDIIEFLHNYAARPARVWRHGFNNDCVHHGDFDRELGQVEFRAEVNPQLNDYGTGFELSDGGEILSREPGYEMLLDARMPITNRANVEARVDEAVRKFRRHSASLSDKREAVRLLTDVMEFLRPEARGVLTHKDEADLFSIANNFGIRHHNQKQKTGYDPDIWLRWMFYHYLSTIHVAARLIAKQKASPATAPGNAAR
jgi:hypothetical protein